MTIKDIVKSSVFYPFLRKMLLRYSYYKRFDKDAVRKKLVALGYENPRKELKKIRLANALHLWLPEEYLSYHYDLLSKKGRESYVLNWEKDYFAKKVNPKKCWDILNDKYASYLHFKKYYKRDAIGVLFKNESEEINELRSFLSNKERVIVKPLSGGSGHGVMIFEGVEFEEVQKFYSLLSTNYRDCIIEEVINQDERMAKFHPSSVNTLRMSVIRNGEDNVLFHPFMRIGMGGAIVDNGGKGGILASIDTSSGIITGAVTEDGREYVIHPDTKIPIIGFKIPLWEEAKDFTRQLMDALPEGIYMSWDIALSEKGWLMIEGNVQGQLFGQQLPNHHGVKDELNVICAKLNVNIYD